MEDTDCAVCILPLVDPVTTPCGHNFCLKCWQNIRTTVSKKRKLCPLCREKVKGTLRINTVLKSLLPNRSSDSSDANQLNPVATTTSAAATDEVMRSYSDDDDSDSSDDDDNVVYSEDDDDSSDEDEVAPFGTAANVSHGGRARYSRSTYDSLLNKYGAVVTINTFGFSIARPTFFEIALPPLMRHFSLGVDVRMDWAINISSDTSTSATITYSSRAPGADDITILGVYIVPGRRVKFINAMTGEIKGYATIDSYDDVVRVWGSPNMDSRALVLDHVSWRGEPTNLPKPCDIGRYTFINHFESRSKHIQWDPPCIRVVDRLEMLSRVPADEKPPYMARMSFNYGGEIYAEFRTGVQTCWAIGVEEAPYAIVHKDGILRPSTHNPLCHDPASYPVLGVYAGMTVLMVASLKKSNVILYDRHTGLKIYEADLYPGTKTLTTVVGVMFGGNSGGITLVDFVTSNHV